MRDLCMYGNCQERATHHHSFIVNNYRWQACGSFHMQLLLEKHNPNHKREHAKRMLAHLDAQRIAAARLT